MRATTRLALALLPLLATLPACSDDDGGGGDRCTRLLPSDQGPGDTERFFPLALGDRWLYEETGTGGFLATEVEVTGESSVDGVLASVVTSSPLEGWLSSEELLRNGPSGVSVHASATDPFPIEGVVPYVELRWPLTPGDAYTPVACTAVDVGEDLDGDGRSERMSLRVAVTVGGDEEVSVPAGTFTARRVSVRSDVTVHATSGVTATARFDEVDWYAPGVGLVRAVADFSGDVATSHYESVLVGYDVGDVRAGLQERRRLTTALAGDRPPAAVRAGDGHLLFHEVPGASGARLATVRLDAEGNASDQLGPMGWTGTQLSPAAAASGEAVLVASTVCTTYCDELRALRLGQDGALLDPPLGALVASGSGSTTLYPPAVASDGSGWLVTWATYGGGTHAARVGPGGDVLGTIPLSTADTGFPRVAYGGGVYLVVFTDSRDAGTRVSGLRVSPSGEVLDPAPFPITTAPGAKWLGGVASDGERFLVVWDDGRRGDTAGGYPALDVLAARVTAAGELLDGPPDTGGLVVNALPGQAKLDPGAAFVDGRFVVTWWIDGYWPPAGAYAARVTLDGALVDGPAGGTGLHVAGPAASTTTARARFPLALPAADGETLVLWTEDAAGLGGAWYAW